MELPSQEGDEMPIPLNSTYGGGHGHGHMIHHHHHHDHHPPPAPPHNHIIIPSSTAAIAVAGGGGPGPAPQIPSTGPPSAIDVDHLPPFKKIIRYRECLKNHAAAMGGNATDGCGEFMPSGDEGTLEALTCSACSCHRNFHRKETDGDAAASCDTCSYHNVVNPRIGRKLFMGHHHHKGYLGAPPDSIGAYHHHAAGALMSSRAVQPHQMIMSYNMGGGGGGGSLPSESDEQEGNNGGGGLMVRPPHMVKKRFRTKFSQEQKEKMLNFAEKVGWKIQKQEEGVVQQFCQEVGVKRRVLKVWMHNNKHTLAKKTLQSDPQIQSLGTD